jgi:hypothetical protein
VPAVPGRTLVAYDLLILSKGARAAFGGPRDRLLLLIAAPLLLLIAIEGAGSVSATLGEVPAPGRMLAAMLAGLAPNLAIGRRLAHLREHSAVAAAALRREAAAAYAIFWNAFPACLAMALFLAGTGSVAEAAALAPPLLLSYAAGAAAAFAARRAHAAARLGLARRRAARGERRPLRLTAPSRRRRVADLIASRTGLPRLPLGANMLAFTALGALATASSLLIHADPGRAEAFAALAFLLLFALLLRQQAAVLRYLLFLGDAPAGAALVPLALAGSLAVGAVAAAAGTGLGKPALAAAAALLAFAAAALLRGLHHAVRPRRAADLAIHLDFAAFLVAGIVLPWLALPLLAVRLFLLHRQAQTLRHIAP